MKRIVYIIYFLSFALSSYSQSDLVFTQLDSLFAYADKNSSVTKTNYQQTLLARYQKVAALANVVNLRSPVSFALTDNTTLPVSFFPGGILPGSNPGTFSKVTLGQQYVGNFNINPQIDVINTGAWSQIKTANINEELTGINNLLNKKSLYESIAACYYNICSLTEQVSIAEKNLAANDTLLQIVNNKYSQGLVRQQDVNDAAANKWLLQDNLNQLKASLQQQYNSLKILCEIQPNTKVIIDNGLNYNQSFMPEAEATSQLQAKASMLQMQYAKSDLRTNRLLNLPVLSLQYSNTYYQNSTRQFFDATPTNKWLNSAFLGAKVTFFLPDVNHLLSSRNAKINYETARVNMEHGKLQNDINNNQLKLDYEKAYSQFVTNQQISKLKDDNYKMALSQYNQAILPFDKLLLSFNDMLVSRLNYNSALANLLYTKTKIDINNQLK